VPDHMCAAGRTHHPRQGANLVVERAGRKR